MLPPNLRRLLGGRVESTGECEGAKHHSPTPLVLHEVAGRHGSTALLCGTCLDNYRVYTKASELVDGSLPWDVRREFGNALRAVARRLIGTPDDA